MSNKTLFKIHGWLGLNFGLLLFVICLSGTFATLSNEVDWLVNDDMRIQKSNQPVQWQAMVESLREQYPTGRNLGMYKGTYTGNADYFATVAYMAMPNDQTLKVYLNPSDGTIQGSTSFFNTQRFFRTFHRRFFDGDRGIFIVTLLSFPMLIIAVTGFLFYKGWLKNLFTLRLHRKPRITWSDSHKLAGIWSLLFVVLIALTGVFYFAELMTIAADKNEALLMPRPPQVSTEKLVDYGETISLLPMSVYVDSAKSAYPGLDIRGVRIPHKAGDFVYINGQAGNPLTRDRANHVMLNPATAKVEHVLKSADLTLLPFITDIADPLHFGYFGGLPTKIIWFMFGLIVSFSILSGTYLWFIKLVDKQQKMRARGKQIPVSFWLRGVTVSITVSLIYFFWILFATFDGIHEYGAMPQPLSETIAEQRVGPWNTQLRAAHYFDEPDKHYLEFKFKDSPATIPNAETTSLNLFNNRQLLASLDMDIYGKTNYLAVDEAFKDQINKADSAHIEVQGFSGAAYGLPIATRLLEEGVQTIRERASENAEVPQRLWPTSPHGIWIYIGLFIVVTTLAVIWWARLIFKHLNSLIKHPQKLKSN